MQVGEIYQSNYWGDVEILEYINNRSVNIKFLNSGNCYWVQRVNIRNGLVKDTIKQATDKNVVDKEHKAAVQSIKIFQRFVRDLQKWDSDQRRYIKAVTKERKIRLSILYRRKWEIKTLLVNKQNRQKQARKYYEANREIVLQQAKDWQRDNPEKARIRNRNRRARRTGAEGSSTLEEQNNLLIEQNNKCTACQCALSDDKHLDHIMPLALGGSNWIENLQWLCPFCNISKNAKHPDIWAAEILTTEFQERRNSRIIL